MRVHTTPQDLVAALGLGKSNLYNAFDSKRALFQLTLRRYWETNRRRLQDSYSKKRGRRRSGCARYCGCLPRWTWPTRTVAAAGR
ncbi:TetR/AcrR family transcriptional regulator [Streptomyces sp. NBC_01604]|nr:TetR/AcrR family transcriptional regulator [Streptomyces sp. NBC_01373]